jgi:hypothetical protein
MLSASDADLAKRDPGLPGLATLLDAKALAEVLRYEAGLDLVQEPELEYLRYKPATNCLAAYRVGADDTGFIYAKAHGRGDSAKLSKARALGASAVLEDRGITVFGFPNDAKLRTLSRIADPERRDALLARVLGPDSPRPSEPLCRLGYKPERRYVGHLREVGDASAVLKFYASDGFPVAVANSRAFESREVLRVATRIGRSKRHRVLAFEWIHGITLRESLAERRLGVDEIARLALALAELHAQRSDALLPRRVRTRVCELRELAVGLGFLCPPMAERAVALADRVCAELARIEPRWRSIHGDLYDKQILLDRERVAIIDLDQASLGDPRSDLGLFLAHLERDVLLGTLSATHARELSEGMLAGYECATGVRSEGLAVHVAESLLRLAHHPFRRHEPDWVAKISDMLSRADEILGERR